MWALRHKYKLVNYERNTANVGHGERAVGFDWPRSNGVVVWTVALASI